jgi:hypothetical protein
LKIALQIDLVPHLEEFFQHQLGQADLAQRRGRSLPGRPRAAEELHQRCQALRTNPADQVQSDRVQPVFRARRHILSQQ